MSHEHNIHTNNTNNNEFDGSEEDMDEMNNNWGEVDPNDPIADFIDRIETTGSLAFDNMPADLFDHPGMVSLVWRMGYEDDILTHCPETLNIDDKTFLFDKHVSFSPLHQTDEVVMRVSFYLNEHEVANSTLCIDEEKSILNDEAFLLLRRFKLTEATVPKIESYQINLFQKDWDNLFALEAGNARNMKHI